MNTKQIQTLLNANGFPCGAVDGIPGTATKLAVRRFQTACAFSYLAIDGTPGPITIAELEKLPRLSEHFVVNEVRCRGTNCCGNLAYVNRAILINLEMLRTAIGDSLSLVDAYRCPVHNKRVGGVGGSTHTLGVAADLSSPVSLPLTLSVNLFSGVGRRGNLASHVDVRHVLGRDNPTPTAIPTNPAQWSY